MPSNESIETVYYSSLYRHGVDEKRRLQIPSKWRSSDPNIVYTLITWPKGTVQDACLLVLPPAEFEALVQKMKSMPYSDPTAEALRRIIGTRSDRMPLDKSGRIMISEKMAKAVGIEKEAVLVGMLDRFEIWNPEKYDLASAMDAQMAPEAFKMI